MKSMNNAIVKNKKVLITAGPTREAIDPVRYISNHSSGKMGYAIAEAFLQKGAEVFLVSGPVGLHLKHPNLTVVNVNSANEMYLACCHFFEVVNVAVFAAADYRVEKIADKKIKKDDASFAIKMVKNIDIAYEFGHIKTNDQLSVGFALETNDELEHAVDKLTRKNFDMVVLNSLNDEKATFGFDTNKITIVKKDLSKKLFGLKSKAEVAEDIVLEVSNILFGRETCNESSEVFEYETMYA